MIFWIGLGIITVISIVGGVVAINIVNRKIKANLELIDRSVGEPEALKKFREGIGAEGVELLDREDIKELRKRTIEGDVLLLHREALKQLRKGREGEDVVGWSVPKEGQEEAGVLVVPKKPVASEHTELSERDKSFIKKLKERVNGKTKEA